MSTEHSKYFMIYTLHHEENKYEIFIMFTTKDVVIQYANMFSVGMLVTKTIKSNLDLYKVIDGLLIFISCPDTNSKIK